MFHFFLWPLDYYHLIGYFNINQEFLSITPVLQEPNTRIREENISLLDSMAGENLLPLKFNITMYFRLNTGRNGRET